MLFVIGLIASGVAFTSHRRATEAALLSRQVKVLQGFGNDVVTAGSPKAIISVTARTLASLFQAPAFVMLVAEGKAILLDQAGDADPREADLEAAQSSLATGTVMRSGAYPNLASRFDFWPVVTADGHNGVVAIAFDPDERPSRPDALVDIVVRVLALVLDRQHGQAERDTPPVN